MARYFFVIAQNHLYQVYYTWDESNHDIDHIKYR